MIKLSSTECIYLDFNESLNSGKEIHNVIFSKPDGTEFGVLAVITKSNDIFIKIVINNDVRDELESHDMADIVFLIKDKFSTDRCIVDKDYYNYTFYKSSDFPLWIYNKQKRGYFVVLLDRVEYIGDFKIDNDSKYVTVNIEGVSDFQILKDIRYKVYRILMEDEIYCNIPNDDSCDEETMDVNLNDTIICMFTDFLNEHGGRYPKTVNATFLMKDGNKVNKLVSLLPSGEALSWILKHTFGKPRIINIISFN